MQNPRPASLTYWWSPESVRKSIMLIADRIRAIGEAKELSQGDIEKWSGLKRAYIYRVENGHSRDLREIGLRP